jgi:hypothetical protein
VFVEACRSATCVRTFVQLTKNSTSGYSKKVKHAKYISIPYGVKASSTYIHNIGVLGLRSATLENSSPVNVGTYTA